MRDMADCIGAYETLLISDRYGGQEIYIPADATKNPFLPLIGAAKARALSWTYRRITLPVPTAGYALRRARRAGIVAAVRSGDCTVADMARMLGIRRDYASKLVNQTDEGRETLPLLALTPRQDHRQLSLLDLVNTGGG